MSSPLREQLTVAGINDFVCLRKLQTLLTYHFALDVDRSLPSHMAFKTSLTSPSLTREIHIEIFTNERVDIKASREVARSFHDVCSTIKTALQEAVDILSRGTSVRAIRAGRILEYMRNISFDEEVGRMVIVTLCDIILDLLVTEKLSRFITRRRDLENESVAVKVGMLKQKVPVYKSKEICDIRTLRNRVAHGGASIAREEAIFARDTTIDIFELF